MVMLIEPLQACLQAIRDADPTPARVIYLSPQGARLTQAKVRELAALPRMVLLCGRYEGIDERFTEANVDEEISSATTCCPGRAGRGGDHRRRGPPAGGALNDAESAAQDSFEGDLGLLDCPHYSQPAQHPLGDVPEVLRSGNHAAIAAGAASSRCSGLPSDARTCWMNRRWARPTANCWTRPARPGNPRPALAQGWLYRLSWPITASPGWRAQYPKQTCSTVR